MLSGGAFSDLLKESPCHRTLRGKGGLGASLGEVSMFLCGIKQERQFPDTQGAPGGSEKLEKGLLSADQCVLSFCALYLVLIQV